MRENNQTENTEEMVEILEQVKKSNEQMKMDIKNRNGSWLSNQNTYPSSSMITSSQRKSSMLVNHQVSNILFM